MLRSDVRPTLTGDLAVAWDEIAKNTTFYVCSAYLRGWTRFDPSYVVVWEDSALVGAAACHVLSGPQPTLPFWNDLHAYYFGALPSLIEGLPIPSVDEKIFYPQLVCGPFFEPENDILIRPGLARDDRKRVLKELLDRIVAIAQDAGSEVVVFPALSLPVVQELRELHPDAVTAFRAPAMKLDVPAVGSFEEYTRSLSKNHRHQVTRDQRAFAAAGMQVELRRISECEEFLLPLLLQVLRRQVQQDRDTHTRAEASLHACRSAAEHAHVITCSLHGDVVGYSLDFIWGPQYHGRITAVDIKRAGRQSAAYFNIGYYEPIRLALQKGLRVIECGAGSWETKLLRGCRAASLYTCLIPTRPDSPIFGLRSYLVELSRRWVERLRNLSNRLGWVPGQGDRDFSSAVSFFRDGGE